MTPKEVFGIVVRSIGLLMMISWVFAITTALLVQDGSMFLNAFFIFAIGGYLLKGAPVLIDWAYSVGGKTVRSVRASDTRTQE